MFFNISFDTIATILFLFLFSVLIFLNRKKLDTKWIVPYLIYFSMYRTKFGLGFMDSVIKKYRKIVIYLGYLGILVGFLGMILIGYGLINSIYVLITSPKAAPGVGLVLPIKAKGIFFVPFFYWIISIFFIAIIHEFSHGLLARASNIKVKSSGFAFLSVIVPIIPAAFVEPDEKKLKKVSRKEQLSVFAAGPFSNILAAFLILGLLYFIIAPLTNAFIDPDGVKVNDYVKNNGSNSLYPAQSAGMGIGEVIYKINNVSVQYVENLSTILKDKKPGEVVTIKTDKALRELKLAKNPENESLAYIGAYLTQNTKIKDSIKNIYGDFFSSSIVTVLVWVSGLFVILVVLNLGIGLFNLVPIGPLDGGRMLQVVLHKVFDKERGNKIFYYIGLFFFVVIFVNIIAGFVK